LKTLALAAGADALALTAGSALAAKPAAKGASVTGPSQPLPYSQLDAYMKASPKQRASTDWWSEANTGTSTDTSATVGQPSESAPPVDDPSSGAVNPSPSASTPPDTANPPGVAPPDGAPNPH
jgi:hypothetical protein